jgi:hypothetical protein
MSCHAHFSMDYFVIEQFDRVASRNILVPAAPFLSRIFQSSEFGIGIDISRQSAPLASLIVRKILMTNRGCTVLGEFMDRVVVVYYHFKFQWPQTLFGF